MMEPHLAKQRRQEILREVERNRLVKGFLKIASSTEGRGTMQEPVFNETMQLGIVVRDLEATVRRFEDDYGIGPWEFHQMDLGAANDYREYGEPVERSNRIAIAYLDTLRDLGVTIEIFSGTPGAEQEPDATDGRRDHNRQADDRPHHPVGGRPAGQPKVLRGGPGSFGLRHGVRARWSPGLRKRGERTAHPIRGRAARRRGPPRLLRSQPRGRG